MSAPTIYQAGRAQFQDKRGELEFLEVPEWNVGETEPEAAKVYYYANPNVAEFLEIAKNIDLQTGHTNLEVIVDAFAACARDASGRRLFTTEQQKRELLEYYDPEILAGVVHRMGVLEAVFERGNGKGKP